MKCQCCGELMGPGRWDKKASQENPNVCTTCEADVDQEEKEEAA